MLHRILRTIAINHEVVCWRGRGEGEVGKHQVVFPWNNVSLCLLHLCILATDISTLIFVHHFELDETQEENVCDSTKKNPKTSLSKTFACVEGCDMTSQLEIEKVDQIQ